MHTWFSTKLIFTFILIVDNLTKVVSSLDLSCQYIVDLMLVT